MNVELITRDDLEKFKKELFEEIRKHSPHPRKQGQETRAWLKSFEVRWNYNKKVETFFSI
ncbi:hypothetical protein GCM10023231_13410 [Olivibacter ginsenosidimutans]|uniref:Uncharacterized protein n=1 Tax=Olivibacter ginsenosidimutans TaxID=1176537 RepID=A0ABP9AV50_9SPHI